MICESDLEVRLYFGSTMATARALYSHVWDPYPCKDNHIDKPLQSFHAWFSRGSNISETYLSPKDLSTGKWDFQDYFTYWRMNHYWWGRMPAKDAHIIFDKMAHDGKITKKKAEEMRVCFEGKSNEITIAPEVYVRISYPYEEVASMGSNQDFVNALISSIKEAVHKAGIVFPPKNR